MNVHRGALFLGALSRKRKGDFNVTKKLTKRIICFVLTFAMAAALMPTASFAAGGAAEPLADGTVSAGSLSSDDALLSEDTAADAEPFADENILEGPLSLGGARLSEDAAADEASDDTDGEAAEPAPSEAPADGPMPQNDEPGIETMSLGAGVALTSTNKIISRPMRERM